MKYHCYIYINAYESVYDSDVEAGSAAEAAAKAAAEHGQQGQWTVIAGEPVYVDVVMRPTYEIADSNGAPA